MTLRDEAARLFGYSSFAAQKLRHQIIKSPGDVENLLDDLYASLQQLAQRESHALQRMTDTPDSRLRLWDFDFYHDRMLREHYRVDLGLNSEYFPAYTTIRRMLDVLQILLGL